MRAFNNRLSAAKVSVLIDKLEGIPGIVKVEYPKNHFDPHLTTLTLWTDPIMLRGIKSKVNTILRESGNLVFSTGQFWSKKPQVNRLFAVYEDGLQIHLCLEAINRIDAPKQNRYLSEFILSSEKDAPEFCFTEALLVALRYLYSGNTLGAQTCMFRCVEALKQLFVYRYQSETSQWSALEPHLQKELLLLLEATTSDLHPLELSKHFVQLTNMVMHLMDSWSSEHLAKVELLGLIQGRTWMEEALVFRKQFMSQMPWRQHFNTLSIKIFGLDFNPWYEMGAWNPNYQPYAFFKGQRAIANVSLSTMQLLIEGEAVPGIQIATVMTDEAWRRMGLSYALFQNVFADYPPEQHLYFLAADDMAVSLYEALGFVPWQQTSFWVDIDAPAKKVPQIPTIPYQAASLEMEEMINLHQKCRPISHSLCCLDDHSILMFYMAMGLQDSVYALENGVYAILESKGDQTNEALCELVVYRFFVPEGIDYDFNTLIEQATQQGFIRVSFLFTPDSSALPVKNLKSQIDQSAQWMVHSGFRRGFPKGASFPSISKT